MVLERILLQTIKFDLQVEHPYQFLLKYAKQLKGKETEGVSVGLLLGFSSASDGTQDFCMLGKCSTLKPHPQLFFFFLENFSFWNQIFLIWQYSDYVSQKRKENRKFPV